MRHVEALAVCTAIVIASLCCPPLEAAPMVCPVTGEECNASDRSCEDNPPQVPVPAPAPPTIAAAPLAVLDSAPILPSTRRLDVSAPLFWRESTRTIQLRI